MAGARLEMKETELLTGLSVEELEVLADGMLVPASQSRLDELLGRKNEGALSPNEAVELDRLLRRADQLTILKTRARYTLQHTKAQAGA